MAPIYKAAFASLGFALICSAARADLSISNKPTQNMSCAAGVCTATARKAVLNVGDLQTMLANGNVAVKTGALATDIDIDQSLTWANISRLTLDAQRSVIVKKPVTVTGTGALTITTNDGGSKGIFATIGKGDVNFSDTASSLVINGKSYTLVKDITSLASAIAAKPSGNFALAKSYDAKADGTYRKVPIPTHFRGKLEGLGNTIAHLAVQDSSSNEVGLFAKTETSSVIENIALTHLKVSGANADGVGGIAGSTAGTLRNVRATGTVYASPGQGSSGGLAGGNGGTITQSSAACTVTGFYAGGLVGADGGTISKSFANGSETGAFMGGITGFELGLVEDSYSTGTVTVASSAEGGGIAGSLAAGGTVERSFSSGAVAGGDGTYVGGIAGYLDGGTVDQSFSTGAISTGSNGAAGGLVAGMCTCEGYAIVTNSYATGTVQGEAGSQTGGVAGFIEDMDGSIIKAAYSTAAISGSSTYEGGFIGFDDNPGDIASGYWDLDTSGIPDPSRGAGDPPNDPGITGLTDAQLKSALPAGFDPKIWGSAPNINNGYPYLLANPPK